MLRRLALAALLLALSTGAMAAPVVTQVAGEISLLSMLYATSDASLVYELQTEASDLHSRDDALATITPPIADELRGAGLIR